MTKKHFKAIVNQFIRQQEIINCTYKQESDRDIARKTLYDLARDLCYEFKQINPNFDYNKFLSACKF